MKPMICSRCKKNMAVVFITKMENGKTSNEGLCLNCARELGIKPVEDMISRMGLTEEDLENLSGEMGVCERPLRASTAQGERIALSSSETAPAGTYIDIEINCLTKDMHDLALECLDYGKLRGIGQWRNSGKGRYTYEILD